MGNNKLHSTIYLRCIGSISDFGDILIAMFLPELSDKLSDVYTAPIGHLGLAVGNVRRFSPPLILGTNGINGLNSSEMSGFHSGEPGLPLSQVQPTVDPIPGRQFQSPTPKTLGHKGTWTTHSLTLGWFVTLYSCLSFWAGWVPVVLAPTQAQRYHTLALHSAVFSLFMYNGAYLPRADSRFAPRQWETALLCNDVSHWLGASLESALPTTKAMLQTRLETMWCGYNKNFLKARKNMFLMMCHIQKCWKWGARNDYFK